MTQKAVIFSAPSGSGKTTIVKRQLELFSQLTFSISATTRSPRENEKDGVDYYFLSNQEFNQKMERAEFIEYEEVYPGTYYATLKSEVERIWKEGKTVIFDVDVVGGLNLKNYFGDKSLAIFIRPPSLESLRERLIVRGSESESSLKKRLEKAKFELTFEDRFDHTVLNSILEDAVEDTRLLLEDFFNQP